MTLYSTGRRPFWRPLAYQTGRVLWWLTKKLLWNMFSLTLAAIGGALGAVAIWFVLDFFGVGSL
jgi:hypothetical protein